MTWRVSAGERLPVLSSWTVRSWTVHGPKNSTVNEGRSPTARKLSAIYGGATAAGLTRVVKSLLFGLTPTDPAVFLVAITLLAVATLGAGYAPAWRAARVDPTVALRHE